MDDPLIRAGLYLEQAERVRELGLNENRTNMRDNLLALAENYYLLHDQFAELGQSRGSEPPYSAPDAAAN